MRNRHLFRLGALLSFTVVILLTLGGGAHAYSICIPFIGCFNIPFPSPHAVPEIDPTMAVRGVTLLIASTLVLVDRLSA